MGKVYNYGNSHGIFDIKDVDFGTRTVKGIFTRYNVKDSDGDIGVRGMFTKTWAENGPKSSSPRIKMLLNHDSWQVPGVITDLWDDQDNAYYSANIGDHLLGIDFMKMAQSGIITEHSYGYQRIREQKTTDANMLLEVKQWELSALTAWGANQFTPLLQSSKAEDKVALAAKLLKRSADVEKFCRNTTATDETIQLLLIENKQLQQLIIDLTTQPDASTVPEQKITNDAILQELKQFTQKIFN